MKKKIFIGTRASLLATTQSNWVKTQIENRHPEIEVELVKITTKGDKILDVPLAKVGGKGLFVKEIEEALLAGEVDLAVHSMKDVPAEIPPGLSVAIIPPRENPFDAFISLKYQSISSLPSSATIGTSSLRRKSQLHSLRPDLEINDLRGNLDTRLAKLDSGEYDAIILAAAGLNRLAKQERITSLFSVKEMVPAVGQGALGIEVRDDDKEILSLLEFLHDAETACTVKAERGFLLHLEGGCQVPIGGHATLNNDTLSITGLIAATDGSRILRAELSSAPEKAEETGIKLAEQLLAAGGREILSEVY